MLQFPNLQQVDRRFAVWLMCRVNNLTRTIVLDSTKTIELDARDVNRVFGIPCRGKRVDGNSCTDRQTITKILTLHLQASKQNARSMKPAVEIITRNYNTPMTKEQCDAFKVAFIIYIMSALFNPTSRFDLCVL